MSRRSRAAVAALAVTALAIAVAGTAIAAEERGAGERLRDRIMLQSGECACEPAATQALGDPIDTPARVQDRERARESGDRADGTRVPTKHRAGFTEEAGQDEDAPRREGPASGPVECPPGMGTFEQQQDRTQACEPEQLQTREQLREPECEPVTQQTRTREQDLDAGLGTGVCGQNCGESPCTEPPGPHEATNGSAAGTAERARTRGQ